ncbi:hypothetical protein PybrP1_005583 [[Pythium] brassicae (nom. inval.)]|nr:hypothetical protein PybrP1_005583 [[Pythium] brassicae (nom. inval.)]
MASARARLRDDVAAASAPKGAGRLLLLAVGAAAAAAGLALAALVARAAPHAVADLLQLPVLDASNIGNVRAEEFLAYGPIDVVYTWVNGTDPRWKAEKEYWHKHWIASLTGQPLPQKPEDTQHVKGSDTSNADNRFRDNEELRYSLRSLEKYAPWVRRIFVVTDGQIPSWLNLASPKVQIVPHREIFANASHLPVFSSPAIEWNLDNIPGLSDAFLYFNDDVFLGARVHPEDFVSQQGVQKAYFAWEIPLCSPGCWDASLQNGRCDRECNVTACDFDMGDCGCDVAATDGAVTCDPVRIAAIKELEPRGPRVPEYLCDGSCHFRWLGDGSCDAACNISACGFDAGDCDGTSQFDALDAAELRANHTLVHVPLAVNATVLNLTAVFGANGSVVRAEHDNELLVRHAAVFEDELLLLLVFGRDDDGDALTSSAAVSVLGRDANGTHVRLDFALVRGSQPVVASDARDGGFYTFKNTTVKPRNVRLPFGLRQATVADRRSGDDALADDDSGERDADDADEEEAEEQPSDADRTDGELHSVTPVSPSDFLQELDVVLPFNLTGKHLKEGDVLVLGMDAKLRLHDEPEDFDWVEYQLCRVVIPDLTPAAGGKQQQQQQQQQQHQGEDVGVTSDGSAASADVVSVDGADVSASPVETPVEVAPKTFAFDVLEHIRQTESEPTAGVDHATTQECRLVDGGRAIELKIKIPTFQARDAPVPATGDERDSSSVSEDESAAADTDADAAGVEALERPQVVDGSLCVFNADLGDAAKRYCFLLAVGHFHPHRVRVARKPTPPVKPTPRGDTLESDDDVLLELGDLCIDTTLRAVGMLPRECDLLDVPRVLPSAADASVSAIADASVQNEVEGRRMACEAQQRRLAMRDALRQQEEARRAAGGAVYWVLGSLERAKAALGLNTVVETTADDIDDVEYADVCAPFLAANVPAAAPAVSAANAEALLSKDTFGDSLRFVNKLYNRAFGKAPARRRVPSHMPFLFKKAIIREIKARWPRECDATSAHRFRHPQDMQFSFSYFHYVLNRHKVVHPTLEEIWTEYLDVNRNGILDENELLTVASLAYGDYPPDAFVTEVRACLQPAKQEKVRETSSGSGTVRVTETLTPHVTFQHVAACADIAAKLLAHVRREPACELMPESEVTFHMLSDNYRFAWNQMLGTRARRTKFVCINDDMKHPSTAVSQILHELFLSIWPKRSQFELPYHLKNRYAHIDEYNNARARRRWFAAAVVGVALLVAAYFRRELRALFGFQDIARARAASASKLSADLQRELSAGGGGGDDDPDSDPRE